eukprot:937507-Prymnesium_polylepis.1
MPPVSTTGLGSASSRRAGVAFNGKLPLERRAAAGTLTSSNSGSITLYTVAPLNPGIVIVSTVSLRERER